MGETVGFAVLQDRKDPQWCGALETLPWNCESLPSIQGEGFLREQKVTGMNKRYKVGMDNR